MNPRTLLSAVLSTAGALALGGCGEMGHDAHDDAHDHAHDHAAAPEGAAPEGAAPEGAAPGSTASAASRAAVAPPPFALGAWTAKLAPTADGLTLTAKDATGAEIAPSGEVRVVLTGTGQDEQRVVLVPNPTGWSGAATVAGAEGYTAVVSVQIDGQTQTARVTWGEVPDAAPAPGAASPPPDHDDGHGHGHGHGHGQ